MINNDGIWNEKGISLKIIIYFFFYWFIVFKLFYFVLVCIVFGFVICFIIKWIEKKYMVEINKLNVNKEKEVYEVKIKFFIMIVYEICILVFFIIGFLEKIMKFFVFFFFIVCDDLNIIDCNS